jgi:hypothetical protein
MFSLEVKVTGKEVRTKIKQSVSKILAKLAKLLYGVSSGVVFK